MNEFVETVGSSAGALEIAGLSKKTLFESRADLYRLGLEFMSKKANILFLLDD
jgi:hypothetical protein